MFEKSENIRFITINFTYLIALLAQVKFFAVVICGKKRKNYIE